MTTQTKLRAAIWIATWATGGLAAAAAGQDYTTAVPPTSLYESPPVEAMAPQTPVRLSDEQLDQMLAPIALYPDSLLAQILPAATYPLEVVMAWQWVKANPNPPEAAIDQQAWEPPVKAVAHYPTVLQTLAEHADWTQALGAAFLAQQQDVMESVQRLRQAALDAGNLQSTAEQQVVLDDSTIEILPATPEVLYVPDYDPEIIYLRRPERCPIYFRIHFAIGRWLDNDCDWHHRWVAVGGGWHQGWRFEDHRWRPQPGWNMVVDHRGITRIARGGGVVIPLTRPWAHNRAKPIPLFPAPAVFRGAGGRVEVDRGHIEAGRGRPFSVPRPQARVIETRTPVHAAGEAFGGDGRSKADVDRAVRRADETRSSWAGKAAPARVAPAPAPARAAVAAPVRTVARPAPAPTPAPAPAPVRATPTPRPTPVVTPAPAPVPAPVRAAPTPRPTPVATPAPAPAPAPVRAAPTPRPTPVAAPAPVRAAPGHVRTAPARPVVSEPSPLVGASSARDTDAQSKRGHTSLRK
jgi:hypothetical protein